MCGRGCQTGKEPITVCPMTLPSQYNPFATEPKWQQYWAEGNFYRADPTSGKEPFCIVIPPPNVTGSLHIGHALTMSIQDVLTRYHRMQGKDCLWLPGTDHAGIATQTMVEREVGKESLGLTKAWTALSEKEKKAASTAGGKLRKAMGRAAFLERVWAWKEQSGGQIKHQLQRMGASCDWSRERFTMDPGLVQAVTTAFVRLYAQNLIYRGTYLVNWCPGSQSAISDLEVDMKEVKGSLWYLRYPVVGEPERYVVVATTRPETMLGDTGVAVNPKDERYADLVGKKLLLPIQNREIPVVADESVDPAFGTGCVKLTPAHDPNDFAMGKRHDLEFINLLNPDGSYNDNAGIYTGLDRFEVRKQVVQWFEQHELLEKIEPYTHNVPYSERAGVPVEPYLTAQWFMRMEPLAANALAALAQQEPHFVPQRWEKTYRDWLESIRDWCISRQLWWGHQIPAWYVVGQEDVAPIVAMDEAAAYTLARATYGEAVQLVRDEDVLDTWFSSGLWPFSTMGWPNDTVDLARYFPNSVLVTGFDIIFFWVARMTMMSGALTQQTPFKDVYINGLVRDEKGQKMSKTKGNGIDPLELMDTYGTDALRFTLISAITGAGQDIRMDYVRKTKESPSCEAARNFANKIWNASRFVMLNLKAEPQVRIATFNEREQLELADSWILSRLQQTIQRVTILMQTYELGSAVKLIYEFIWDDFCDWYIELAKPRFNTSDSPVAEHVLITALTESLKLLHPWMPHITEEIWQALTASQNTSISVQPYPVAITDYINEAAEAQFTLLKGVIRTIRNLKAEAGIPLSAAVPIYILAPRLEDYELLQTHTHYLHVVKLSGIHVYRELPPLTEKVFSGVEGAVEVLLPLTQLVDLAALQVKIERDLNKKIKSADTLRERLGDEGYRARAPEDIVQKSETELEELERQIATLQQRQTILAM
jgi:valyl-tRNA synthetase